MANLFGLLFIILFIVTFVLLIKPSLTARGNKAALPRLKIFVYGMLASFASLVMVGLTSPKVDPKKLNVEQYSDDQVKVTQEDGKIVVAPVETEQKNNLQKKSETSLGMTPEQFRKQFNEKLKALKIDSIRPVAEFDVSKGQFKDSFQVMFSDAVSLTGTVNKDGSLHELTYIVGGTQDSERAMMDLLILTGISSQIISPDEPKINTVVIDLINKSLKGIEKENNVHSEIIGNIKYYALASKATGLWFGIAPKEDEL
ncbi:hypothetical protein [Acinetobacter ursingii]|uniref:hypothetical protein n=1 Tax=Acinetobacter ursingii TaxID=108980 RepID=UPI0030092821